MIEKYLEKPVKLLFIEHPYAKDWLEQIGCVIDQDDTLSNMLFKQKESFYAFQNMNARMITQQFDDYLIVMKDMLEKPLKEIENITLCPGYGKNREPEKFKPLTFYPGDIIAVVGPTGSGKSRLLEDIECGANGNTPTGRRILINGETTSKNKKGRARKKIVAQLSQNMHFVIDLTVRDFLGMHSRCWPTPDASGRIERIIELANSLAGEKFEMESNVAELSGGQSRALMIADCALLSSAPIVLIDEIENAGINRRKALKLLTGEDKIIFLTTHDPLLALLAHTRLVIKNGEIHRVIRRTKKEKETLRKLEFTDDRMVKLRRTMRSGEMLEEY
ncbi:ATP-binding cassette domain-containing protein [Alkalibaculum bacchi]|uniref:ATP-binding cassette domain-containing protein n=1 Tax=Alkalibaculum bacchi TaxID=645887 RepID=UPI0026F1A464|nr:ATP-binding cassette domain-containing protein [Alkalibaculum bacchi]